MLSGGQENIAEDARRVDMPVFYSENVTNHYISLCLSKNEKRG